MTKNVWLGWGIPLVLAAAATLTAGGQGPRGTTEPPLVLRSTYGQDLFKFYCSNCHGTDGRGSSPRSSLQKPPPDLTTLSRRNGNVFPRERVRTTVTRGGTAESPGHGTNEMPVWGAIFRGLDPSDTMVEVRIGNLVQYLESIQEP
jgi:mono/diheme cytochrome c family protein